MFKNPHNRRPANALKSKDEMDRTSAFEIHLFAEGGGDRREGRLSILKMLSVENVFEISDIQEDETEASLVGKAECNNVALR